MGSLVMPRFLEISLCAVAIISGSGRHAMLGLREPPSMTLMATWSVGAR